MNVAKIIPNTAPPDVSVVFNAGFITDPDVVEVDASLYIVN